MIMNKKAEGLPINVIIVAIIALVVLIVIIAVFTGNMGKFVNSLTNRGDTTMPCEEQKFEGYILQLKASCEKSETEILASDAASQGMKCCKKKS